MNTLPRNSVCLGAPAKLQRPGNARTGSIWVLLKSAQLSCTYLQLEVTAAQVLDKYWQIRQCHKNTTRHTSSFNSHSIFVLRLAASARSVAMMKSVSLALHLLYRKHACGGRVSTFGLSCSGCVCLPVYQSCTKPRKSPGSPTKGCQNLRERAPLCLQDCLQVRC